MRQPGGRGPLGRIQSIIRGRPLLALAVSVLSLFVIASAVTFTTPLRCGPAKAFGLTRIASGCTTVAALTHRPSTTPTPNYQVVNPNPQSGPFPPVNNPYSCCPQPDGNPASGAYPPMGYPASGSYPPFYPPASTSADWASRPRLDCRLPVFAGGTGSGGFIVYPGASFIADPNSSVTLPAGIPTPPPVGGPGPGYGQNFGLSYDHQYSRWVPVPANQVSPDGSHYAYAPSEGIYIVNVANGTVSEVGAGHSWSLAGVQTDGVYAGDANAGGLWLFPYSGASRQVTRSGYWRAASATAAYGTSTSAVPPGATNTIIRVDLKTGATSEWFARASAQSSVIGVDGKGNAIISVTYINGSGSDILIVNGPSSTTAITGFYNPQYGPGTGFNSYGMPIADSHGIWLTGSYSSYGRGASGLALYTGSAFYWMSDIGGQLAGGCY